ncbi:MAG: PEGA domain-containing protein [Betaproteobacteria bacterium]
MPEAPAVPAAPLNASVAYLRIPQFEDLAVTDQVARKERLFARAQDGLADVAATDRAVLDADDGLAIVFLGEPVQALAVCERIHEQDAFEPVQVGVNYGPLGLASGREGGRVIGDALGGAAAAARFAEPDRLLVTESFARALRITAPDRAADLSKAGDFTDTRVRQHALYAPDPGRSAMRRRRFALYAVGGVAAILLVGVIARGIYQPLMRSRPGVVLLDVKPRGEVYVDGVFHGRTPPMTELQLAPGPHRIQIRGAGSPQYNEVLDVKPGEKHTVSHTFTRSEPRPKPDFWRDLKRKFGA